MSGLKSSALALSKVDPGEGGRGRGGKRLTSVSSTWAPLCRRLSGMVEPEGAQIGGVVSDARQLRLARRFLDARSHLLAHIRTLSVVDEDVSSASATVSAFIRSVFVMLPLFSRFKETCRGI